MRVFLTGATGVLGTQALPALVAAGHQVTAVARTDEKAALVARRGGVAEPVDLFDREDVHRAVAGHEAVVHLATHIPPLSRAARTRAWATNDRLRTVAAGHLVAAARATGASHVVQESICFPYDDQGAAWVDEDSPRTPSAATASAGIAEDTALGFAADGGTAVVLRFAQLYSADSDHVATFHRLARWRIPPLLGPSEGFTSFVHADDAGAAVAAALTAPRGVYNVGDDEPLTRGAANAVIAGAVGAGRPLTVPPALLRMGPAALETLTRSVRVSNARLRAATDWAPSHPSIREGWATVVAR